MFVLFELIDVNEERVDRIPVGVFNTLNDCEQYVEKHTDNPVWVDMVSSNVREFRITGDDKRRVFIGTKYVMNIPFDAIDLLDEKFYDSFAESVVEF